MTLPPFDVWGPDKMACWLRTSFRHEFALFAGTLDTRVVRPTYPVAHGIEDGTVYAVPHGRTET